MGQVLSDIRFALRQLARAPGFASVAILALALGIGANSAIFSVADAVLLRPLPFHDPDRLMIVWEDASYLGFSRNTPAPANYRDWKAMNRVFSDMAASQGNSFTVTGGGVPEVLLGRRVTANFWPVMGVAPIAGRTFTAQEEAANERVAVISHGVWQRRFGGAPDIAGKPVVLNDAKYSIIGVMPKGFYYPTRQMEIWVPASMPPAEWANRGSHYLQTVARLKPGVSVEQAQADLSRVAKELSARYPDENRNVGAVVVPMRDQLAGRSGTAALVLLGAAGCVLLIACANAASIMLARAQGRQREVAIRTALGAGQRRILAQAAVESLVIAALSAVGGILVAQFSLGLLQRLVPESMSDAVLRLDARILLFTLAVTMVTAVLAGGAPAWQLARVNLNDALKQGGRGVSGPRSQGLRGGLVVLEIATAVVLLVGASLLMQTLWNLQSIDAGFQANSILTLSTQLPSPRYDDATRRLQFYERVLDGVRRVPGVVSAGYTSSMPFTALGNTSSYLIEGREGERTNDALVRAVSQQYFQTIAARLAGGRFFSDSDGADAPPAAIINETFAKTHWPNGNPIGARVRCPLGANQPWRTIVGVVKEIRERGLEQTLKPAFYVPLRQSANFWNRPRDLAIRTAVDPLSIVATVREIVSSVDPDQPIRAVRTFEEITDSAVADRRQQLRILGAFAGLALFLASLGVYGLLAYTVSQRTREIGVRMALGATAKSVSRRVVRDGLLLTGAGLALGAGAAWFLSRSMESLLFGVKAGDPRPFLLAAAVLTAVAAVGCYLPARRAAAIDPVITLRDE